MSYNVYLTNGNGAAVVQDGTIDNTYSLSLIGRGVSDYAYILAENFIHHLENFSSPVAPTNPVIGQLWWNRDKNIMYVFTAKNTWMALNLNVDNFYTGNIFAGNVSASALTSRSVTGVSATFTLGNFINLRVANLLTANTIAANNLIISGNITAQFTGPIGKYVPDTGNFTNVTANNFFGNLFGYFDGVIGSHRPNVAAFTNTVADTQTANLFIGNLVGPVNQFGVRYPGSFSNLDADNLLIRNNFTADYITANKGFTGLILTNNQPYITHIGNLDNLNVSGTTTTNILRASTIYGTIATNSQPYITTIGTLGNLRVTGNTVVNTFWANSINAPLLGGTLTTNAQPNVTSLGNLSALTVLTPIKGDLAGTADRAKQTDTANLAIWVTNPRQANITSLGTLANLTVRGPVDLGSNANVMISGGSVGQYLAQGPGNTLVWQGVHVLPDMANHAGQVLTTDGLTAFWQPGSSAAATYASYNLVDSDQKTVTLNSNVAAHTAYTILNLDCTNIKYGELYLEFEEFLQDEKYRGLISIQIFDTSSKYCVNQTTLTGNTDDNALQISSEDAWSGHPLYGDITAVPIQIWDAEVIKGLTVKTKIVQNIKYNWVRKVTISDGKVIDY